MTNEQKREMTLSQIKQTELDILRYFKAFCEKENIRFFLSNGTLLGAVKYGGFIPWDDDVDVFVPRKDYDRLMRVFTDTERYRLFSAERVKHYRFPFAKLCDMTTEKVEDNINNGVRLGIDIDIFPLDAWEDDYSAACKQEREINKRIQLLAFFKCRKALSANPVKRRIKSVMLFMAPMACRLLIRRIGRIAGKNANNPESKWMGCVSWCIYNRREIVPAEIFATATPVSFEAEQYPAPVGYDAYLRSLYGDYTQDPPEEEQVTHHRFLAYKL